MAKYIVISDFDGSIIPCDMSEKILEYVDCADIVETLTTSLSNQHITIAQYMNFVCYALGMEKDLYRCVDPIKIIHKVIEKYNVKVDSNFQELEKYCSDKKYPLYILSGGLKKIIKILLPSFDHSHIFSHDFEVIDEHVKFMKNEKIVPKGKFIEEQILKYGRKIIFIGDGTSDFTVVKFCHIVFAKRNSVLEMLCVRDKINYISFDDFSDINKYLSSQICL